MPRLPSYHKYPPERKKRRLTYILGSRCKDGVVIVADRKFTVDYGDHFVYGEKVFSEVNNNFVLGFSGDRGTFELFKLTLEDSLNDYFKNVSEKIPTDKLILMTSDTIAKINNKFRNYEEGFDAILGLGTGRENASLKFFYRDGKLESIDTVKVIGTGEPYGRIFLQKWNSEMTMEEVAEMGHFIINYIERFELTHAVGVGDEGPHLWFLPDPAFKDRTAKLMNSGLSAVFKSTTEMKIREFSKFLDTLFPADITNLRPPSKL